MKIKNQINIAFGLTITIVCVWLAFRKVPYSEIVHVVSDGINFTGSCRTFKSGLIGVFQFVGQQAPVILIGEKYSINSALAITFIVYIVYYVLSTLLGIIGLWRIGQSFADLKGLVARKKPQYNL